MAGIDRRGNLDWATVCGLMFNIDRVETRKANRVRAGIAAALSARIDRSWFSALAEAEDEAEAAFNRSEAMAAAAEAEREALRTSAADAAAGI